VFDLRNDDHARKMTTTPITIPTIKSVHLRVLRWTNSLSVSRVGVARVKTTAPA
jgi:hypothetical protein